MERTIRETLNKSQGQELDLLCSTCLRETAHEVVVSADVATTWEEPNYLIHGRDVYQITKCKGCRTVTFRQASTDSESADHDLNGNVYYPETVSLFPPRIEGRKSFGFDEWYLPDTVRGVHQETSKALASGLPILTGIGLRALIEAVCKAESAEGNDLFAKIDDLKNKKILTKQGSEILHSIRNLGNKAAHEVRPHSAAQLTLAMDVVEHLLMDV